MFVEGTDPRGGRGGRVRPQLGLPVPTDGYMLDGRPDALGKLGRSMMAEVEEKGR